MRVGVIIPTADAKRDRVQRCLATLRSSSGSFAVDLAVIESSGPGFRFSRSINRGFAQTPDCDAWLLLNDDVLLDPGCIQAMLDAAASAPDVALVGALLRFPDGRLQHAGGSVAVRATDMLATGWRLRAPVWGLREALRRRGRKAMYRAGHLYKLGPRIDYVTAACMLVTKMGRTRLGDFDEAYRFGYEDTDYCLRAREAGLRIVLARRATAMHEERATGPRVGPMIDESHAAFVALWPPERLDRAVRRTAAIRVV